MTADLVLAIDAGGTAVKLAVFDAAGRLVARADAAVVTDHHPNGRVERDAEPFWLAVAEAARDLTSRVAADRIAAVGCTGFGNGVFLVDAAGRPTRPGIVSVDHRADGIVARWVASGLDRVVEAITGQRVWGGQTLAQLVWLAENEPEVVARTRWALLCKDFLRLRLTGVVATDHCDASGSGLLNLADGTCDPALYALVGIPDMVERIPPVHRNSEIVGRIDEAAAAATGLAVGTPVVAGMMDVGACILGSGVLDEDLVTMIAGTWSINARLNHRPLAARPPILNTLHRDGAVHLVADGSPSSAGNLGWFAARILPAGFGFAETNALVATVDRTSASRCMFLPYVQGPAPRRGGFVDLTTGDDLASMLAAIYEGIAFKHRWHGEAVTAILGAAPPRAVRLAGGAAKSAVWSRMFADVTGRPVEVVEGEDLGALGVAMAAAVAAGFHPDLTTAVRAMARVSRTFEPDPACCARHDERYRRFLEWDARFGA